MHHRNPLWRVALAGVTRFVSVVSVGLLLLVSVAGCATTPEVIEDPLGVLRDTTTGARRQTAAMVELDAAPEDEAYLEALQRVVWRPGYTVSAREAAFSRLAERDPEGLERTLRQQLPRMTAWAGLTRLCELIADEQWVELSPALVSSWARPVAGILDERERPERKALVRLHGEDRVADVVFELLVGSRKVSDQGLRTRAWELLHRLGERDRLRVLLVETSPPDDDAFLRDLHTAATEIGVVPYNREEILWLRRLLEPSRRSFWDEAVAAVRRLPERRRQALEIRDLPIAVSAARHEPELLDLPRSSLYDRLDSYVAGQRRYSHGSNYDGFNANRREGLHDWRNELTWGDLAAMLMAVRAFEVRPVVDHLFDYAERDRVDESTEHGGVIALDERGRFEVLEFPPRIRQHDRRFNASQEMMDAAYTSLFHFHFHAQRHRNGDFAGPGFGDVNYADSTRANCLVLTFVRETALNVDFYRHGRVLVDLGVIERR